MPAALSKIPVGVIPAVKLKCAEVIRACPQVTHVWGGSTTPDHNTRRCIDFMVSSIADGQKVAAYLKANAKRLGINGMIFNRQVMGFPSNGSSYRGPEGQWRTYSGPSPHTDHVHVEFNSAAYKTTTTAGKPAKPAASGTWYHIDPAKVSTFLYVLGKNGQVKGRQKAGYNVRAVRIETRFGRKNAVTRFGNYYALSYLKKGKA